MLFRDQHTLQSVDAGAGGKEVPATAGEGHGGERLTGSPGDSTTSDNRTTLKALVLITASVLLFTIPFLWQPYHIDDLTFLDSARNQIENPFQLHIDDYHLIGEDLDQWRDTHPPALPLYLAAVIHISGSDAEPVTHASYIVFPLIAAISMYYLARRFTRNALLATLLLLATPAVMTNSHLLMGDMPTTAAWLAATALYIYGIDRKDRLLLALSSVAITLALFIGYQALALILLLPLYALLRRRLDWLALAPLTLPLLAFAAFSAYNIWVYDDLPRFTHRGGLGLTQNHLWSRLQGAMLRLGGATIFPLALVAAFAIRKLALVLLPLAVAISAGLAFYYQDHGNGLSTSGVILYTLFMSVTMVALGTVLVDFLKQAWFMARGRQADADTLYLGLWLGSVLAVIIVLLPHSTVKYYLPVLAPFALLMVRELERQLKQQRLVQYFLLAAIALGLTLSLLISIADYRYAQTYRDLAREVSSRYPDEADVWFIGEWGFRYYMEQEGYRYLTSESDEPVQGDIVVDPSLMDWPITEGLAQRLVLMETLDVRWSVPLRVMSIDADAGYYGSYWGILPYAYSDVPLETFRIYRVESG